MAENAKSDGKKRGGLLGLLIGVVLAVGLGGVSFYAAYSGLLSSPFGGDKAHAKEVEAPAAFLPLDPIMVTVGAGGGARELLFGAQLEVEPTAVAHVETLKPRVIDVLNTYLRAVEAADVEDPAAMIRMRAQMLRRVQVVTGPDMVRDLLVSEFVLR